MDAADSALAGTAGDKGVKSSSTWKSLPLAEAVAATLATRRGLIALYDQSQAIACMLADFAPAAGQAGAQRREVMIALRSRWARIVPAGPGCR